MRELVVGGDDGSLSVGVVLRPASSAEDLEDVQDTEIYE